MGVAMPVVGGVAGDVVEAVEGAGVAARDDMARRSEQPKDAASVSVRCRLME